MMTLQRLVWALLVLTLLAPASAQKLRDKEQPYNAGVQCPYCMGEPELMGKVGVHSHGGFEFSKGNTADADKRMVAMTKLLWIETDHFKIGSALPSIKVDVKDKKKIRAECERLREFLSDVPEKPRVLDPWLRLHLTAMRLEDHYEAYSEFLGVTDADFPAEPATPWNTTGEFMGTGPFLGMNRKYEVMLLPSEGSSTKWLRSEFGLTTKQPQRWHITDLSVIQFTTHLQEGDLKKDLALHSTLVFNTTIMLTNGYKYFAYDLPVWLTEGLAHRWERGTSAQYNTFNSGEGSIADTTTKDDWQPATRKMVQSEDAPSLAALMAMRGPAELTLDRHYASWSMIDYLHTVHPHFLPKLLRRICGITNDQGMTDGRPLPDYHRASFKEDLGMSYPEFDRKWRAWVLETYRSKPIKMK